MDIKWRNAGRPDPAATGRSWTFRLSPRDVAAALNPEGDLTEGWSRVLQATKEAANGDMLILEAPADSWDGLQRVQAGLQELLRGLGLGGVTVRIGRAS